MSALRTQLNGGTLNDAHLTVTSDEDESDEDEPQATTPRASLDQTDKPRAASTCSVATAGSHQINNLSSCGRVPREGLRAL